jgi:UDPglucose--hexose-1-phosphate uridylyltransferase
MAGVPLPPPPMLPRHDLVHPDGRAFHVYGREGDWDLRGHDPASGHAVDGLHRRFDRLTGTWVLVSPARNVRPSSTTSGAERPTCPLCPGGAELDGGFAVAVFDNRFPALSPDAPAVGDDERLASSGGRCQVVVHTARHGEHAGDLCPGELVAVGAVLRERTAALWRAGHTYVMAFENHGAAVGATLPHQHGQIYALDHLPPAVAAKREQLGRHRGAHGTCLGCTVVSEDLAGERVLDVAEHFVAAVPFAPRWPYEVHVTARRHGIGRLGQLDDAAVLELTRLLADVVDRYAGLWGDDAPYMLCVQEAPAGPDGDPEPDWHLHVELLPPHRNPDRLKVRASVETALGVFINDTVPERTAAELRAVAPVARSWASIAVPTIEAV